MQTNYYTRKIQRFAKYSYAVTLPIDWIKKNNLERTKQNGNISDEDISDPMVNMFEIADGSLQIYPFDQTKSKKPQLFRLDLDEFVKTSPNFIKDKTVTQLLISFYMNGAAGAEIISKSPIPKNLIEQIEKIRSRLLFNWNLTRETNHRILIKNVFTESPENIIEEEIPRYLRECFSILLWMLEDLISAIENEDYSNLDDIIDQDNRIDRYYFFVVREIRTIFEHTNISKPIKFSHKKLIDLRLLAKLIEDVGDSLKDFARNLRDYHQFLNNLHLKTYVIEYFHVLQEAYRVLADYLRKFVVESESNIGLNRTIMKIIRDYRNKGTILEEKWERTAPILINSSKELSFMEFFQGSRLIRDLEDIYKNIFDFTNIFF